MPVTPPSPTPSPGSGRYPATHDPSGLAPKITITDFAGTEKHVFEHPQIAAEPQQDIDVAEWEIRAGLNSDAGQASLLLEGLPSPPVRKGDLVTIELGKTAAGLAKWFYGPVEEVETIRPAGSRVRTRVAAIGIGVQLSRKIVTIDHERAKIGPAPAEGEDDTRSYDPSDTSGYVSTLAKSCLHAAGGTWQTSADPIPGLDYTTDADVINVNLDRYARTASVAGILAELANSAAIVYGVDPDLHFFWKLPNDDSGFLISNDLDSADVQGWPASRLMVMRDAEYAVTEGGTDKGYTHILAVGDVSFSTPVTGLSGGGGQTHPIGPEIYTATSGHAYGYPDYDENTDTTDLDDFPAVSVGVRTYPSWQYRTQAGVTTMTHKHAGTVRAYTRILNDVTVSSSQFMYVRLPRPDQDPPAGTIDQIVLQITPVAYVRKRTGATPAIRNFGWDVPGPDDPINPLLDLTSGSADSNNNIWLGVTTSDDTIPAVWGTAAYSWAAADTKLNKPYTLVGTHIAGGSDWSAYPRATYPYFVLQIALKNKFVRFTAESAIVSTPIRVKTITKQGVAINNSGFSGNILPWVKYWAYVPDHAGLRQYTGPFSPLVTALQWKTEYDPSLSPPPAIPLANAYTDTDALSHNTYLAARQLPTEAEMPVSGKTTFDALSHILGGITDVQSRVRMTYSDIEASCPTDRPPLGRLVRFRDAALGTDRMLLLIGYRLGGDEDNLLAPVSMTVTLEDIS